MTAHQRLEFFEDFCKVFELVAKDIREHNDWEGDIVEKEMQTLLNRLLFLYFSFSARAG